MMTTNQMRAVRIVEPGRTAIEHVPSPIPAANEARLRIEGCGVCASNLGPWKGLPWMSYPMNPGDAGHEAWGVVDALGNDVEEVEVGDRVAALSFKSFAEYDVAQATQLVSLPRSLGDAPFPGEAFGCAMNIFRRSHVVEGQTVAIVGVGFLGAVLTRLASRAGAHVVAISRRPFALDMARRLGAETCIPLHDHWEILDRVKALTRGEMCERVIEAVGMPWPLDLAGDLTALRGRLIVAGYHQDGPRQVNMQMWNWKGLDVINAHERDPRAYVRGMREAVAAVDEGILDPSLLLTHELPLEELGAALDATAERPDGFLKAVVRP